MDLRAVRSKMLAGITCLSSSIGRFWSTVAIALQIVIRNEALYFFRQSNTGRMVAVVPLVVTIEESPGSSGQAAR